MQSREPFTADHWNELIPEGTAVRYYPFWGDWETFRDTRTRSKVWLLSTVLGGHSLVVKIDGQSGGVSVRHLLVDVTRAVKDHLDKAKESMREFLEGLANISPDEKAALRGLSPEEERIRDLWLAERKAKEKKRANAAGGLDED